jgi:hypothetical protein
MQTIDMVLEEEVATKSEAFNFDFLSGTPITEQRSLKVDRNKIS